MFGIHIKYYSIILKNRVKPLILQGNKNSNSTGSRNDRKGSNKDLFFYYTKGLGSDNCFSLTIKHRSYIGTHIF